MEDLHGNFGIGISGVHGAGHVAVDADFEGVGELGSERGEFPLPVGGDPSRDDEADLVLGTLGVEGTEFVQAPTNDTAVFEPHVHRACLDKEERKGGREGG